MKNIFLALDATNIDMSALDFACYLARLTRSKVTGIFLENLVADEKPVLVKMQGFRYLDWEVDESSPEVQEKRRRIDGNVKLFTEACEKKIGDICNSSL